MEASGANLYGPRSAALLASPKAAVVTPPVLRGRSNFGYFVQFGRSGVDHGLGERRRAREKKPDRDLCGPASLAWWLPPEAAGSSRHESSAGASKPGRIGVDRGRTERAYSWELSKAPRFAGSHGPVSVHKERGVNVMAPESIVCIRSTGSSATRIIRQHVLRYGVTTRAVVAVLFLTTLSVLVHGCSDECPGVSDSCDDGCYPMQAFPFDAARGCAVYKLEIVGCTPDDGGTDDAPCVKRVRDGALFIATQGSPFRSSSDWAECSDSESAAVMAAECTE